MPNDGAYFDGNFTGQEHGLVRVEQFTALAQALKTGLNKLPEPDELNQDRVSAVVATGGPTAYTVTMASPPSAYVDGIALQVRFPVANAANPTLDIRNSDGVLLGAKPIRQVDGTALTAEHVAAHARAELYYVAQGSGYWTLGAGARGAQGRPGPPAGTFSLNADKELIFTATGGSVTNLGPAAPLWRGTYAAGTTYKFLHIAKSGNTLYLHVGLANTTGTPVSNTSVWQPLARDGEDGQDGTDGADAALRYAFSTSTTMADPAAGDIRLNNASPASATRIAIDDVDAQSNDMAGYVNSWDDTGEANGHGTLFIRDRSDQDILAYRVDGLVDNAGWTRLNVTHLAGTSLPADDAALDVWFVPTGNTGDDASLGSDVTAIDVLTQAAYTALAVKVATTLYVIVG